MCVNASLARLEGKRPSWSPGEGKMKASRKNNCRGLCYTHLSTRQPPLPDTGIGMIGRSWVRSLKVLSQTGWAEVNLPCRGQGRAPLL